jgi:hypothetical protein
VTLNDLLQRLCDELADGDVPDPVHTPLTLGLVWADLARLAGEEPPPEVAALLDEPVCLALARR